MEDGNLRYLTRLIQEHLASQNVLLERIADANDAQTALLTEIRDTQQSTLATSIGGPKVRVLL